MADTEAQREEVTAFIKKIGAIREEIGRVIVGQRSVIDGVLTCLLAGSHALLEGVPGLGKTMIVRTLGQVLGLDFSRIQFTPDLMPADIIGTVVLAEGAGGTKALDIITNGLEAPEYLSGESEGKFISRLLDGSMPSYQTLLQQVKPTDSLRVVDGEIDNTFNPTRTKIRVTAP